MEFATDPLTPNLSVLLYGGPGTGKTTGALSAPDPTVCINVEGPSATRFARHHHRAKDIREPVWEGGKTMAEAYLYARDPANNVRSIVIDSVGELYTSLLEEMLRERPDLDGHASLPMYGDVNDKIARFVRAVRGLETHPNLILVCHEHMDVTDEGPIRVPHTGGKQLPDLLPRLMDVVGYCARIEDAYIAQYVTANGRYGKDRTGILGDASPVDIAAWVETLDLELKHPEATP